jgi:hypothetical protein
LSEDHATVAANDLAAASRLDDRRTQGAGQKRDVPYQSLLKVFLAERIAKELGRS